MSDSFGREEDAAGVRFGRAILVASAEPILRQPVEAIVCPANARGVMGVGVAGAVRMAGGIDIERAAMAKAPLALGSAVLTEPGLLRDRGVAAIIHAVVSDALGSPTRPDIVRDATTATLGIVDRQRIRSLAVPPLGSGLTASGLTGTMIFAIMIEEIVAHLRRFSSRLERVVLICRDERELREVTAIVHEARELWDGLRI